MATRKLTQTPVSRADATSSFAGLMGPDLQPSRMKLILSTHNVTLTKAIEDHIQDRLNKLAHLDRFAINARVTLEHDHMKVPERAFSCSIRLSHPGPDLFAEDSESGLRGDAAARRGNLSS